MSKTRTLLAQALALTWTLTYLDLLKMVFLELNSIAQLTFRGKLPLEGAIIFSRKIGYFCPLWVAIFRPLRGSTSL